MNRYDTLLSGQPRLINFFKPILFLASDSSSGFRRGTSYFFTATKNTTERVGEEEQTNKHGLGSTPSARKEKSMCDALHSPCICRLTLACILRETSTKGTKNADIFLRWLTRPLCSSSGLSSRLSDFCWLCHSLDSQLKADCSPLPSVVDCPLLVP